MKKNGVKDINKKQDTKHKTKDSIKHQTQQIRHLTQQRQEKQVKISKLIKLFLISRLNQIFPGNNTKNLKKLYHALNLIKLKYSIFNKYTDRLLNTWILGIDFAGKIVNYQWFLNSFII